jgi:hypothetical protein
LRNKGWQMSRLGGPSAKPEILAAPAENRNLEIEFLQK